MELSAIVFLVLVAVAVLVIAAYLILVVTILRKVVQRLDVVLEGVGEVTRKSQPIGPVIDSINRDLEAGRDALEACVERLAARHEAAPTIPEPQRYP